MRRLIFFCLLLFQGIVSSGQSDPLGSPKMSNGLSQSGDTIKKKIAHSSQMHKKMTMAPDSLTLSDYTLSLERVNDNLNTIGDSAKLGFEVVKISRRIDAMTNDVKLIRPNIRGRNAQFNLKNLYLYQSFTTKLDDETDVIQAKLDFLSHRLSHAKRLLKEVLSDSIFRKLYANKELRGTFDRKLIRLEWKWNRTDSLTKANADTINAMNVRLSDNSYELSNMINMMDSRLDRAAAKLFGPEVAPLWETNSVPAQIKESSKNTTTILAGEQKAIGYYIGQTSGERALLFVLGITLFVWLILKRKLLKTIGTKKEEYSYLHLQYLNRYPILSLLVVLFCLMPFFDAYAPTSYISIEHLLLLVTVSVIFLKNNERTFFYNWAGLVALLVADILVYLLIEPTFLERAALMAIHSGIIVFTIRFLRSLRKETPYYTLIKSAAFISILLCGVAILFNFFGRFSLSGIIGITAIFAITQALALTVFVEVAIEIILLQLQSSRFKKGLDKPFDNTIVTVKIKRPLVIIAIVVWVIMLLSNLNLYYTISNFVSEALTTTRTLGSISFQMISVILFFFIIWFAHLLQRVISFLFGEMGAEAEDLTTETKGQHSRLLILRLLILIAGYLLAIAVSGLPIDKLTFLLGALGVGIGMGLQNIVNNIVSGIILIFDGSLQIGDEIEVSGQTGKVKEIGLRASTLNTSDGAEVIIPNGNILSQNIVNWTYSNNEKRIMLTCTLSGKELDANMINDLINNTIRNIPNVVSARKPVILYTRVTPETCSLTIRFWCIISKVDLVKSEATLQLSAAFGAKKIGFE